jgi:uncharacterized spore protein YtfJ
MKIQIRINALSKRKLLKELHDIVVQVLEEINSPLCKDCKDKRKGCFVGGGSSETGLESDWKLYRKFSEHKKICRSKNRK